MTQPLVATKQPPALRGFFTIEMCTDYFRQLVMFGGSPQVQKRLAKIQARFMENPPGRAYRERGSAAST